ncbi:hypothetical protein TI04_00745 [Achromatium sp. WMS2]|nr:hypothetical protein TI04_00745 [Achromatium sp. WMS2]
MTGGFQLEDLIWKQPIKILKHKRRAISIFRYGLDYLNRILLVHINDSNKFISALKLLFSDVLLL